MSGGGTHFAAIRLNGRVGTRSQVGMCIGESKEPKLKAAGRSGGIFIQRVAPLWTFSRIDHIFAVADSNEVFYGGK